MGDLKQHKLVFTTEIKLPWKVGFSFKEHKVILTENMSCDIINT